MKIYQKIKTNNSKVVKICGITFSSKRKLGDVVKEKRLFGLFKTKANSFKKKFYVLGIKLFAVKTQTMRLNQADFNRLVNCIGQKTQRSLTVAFLHQKTFGEFRNKYEGKTVTLIGAGPTVSFFGPIENSVYVGLNRAFLFDKVHFDYLFTIDKWGLDTGTVNYMDDFINYDSLKFVGDQNGNSNYQIPQSLGNGRSDVRRYKTTSGGYLPNKFALDIDTEALANSVSVALQAMQFILFTNPKRVYIVGIDCTGASNQHFKGSGQDGTTRGQSPQKLDEIHKKDWHRLKDFVSTYYPETEIISVNPVGLKGLFHDVYTESYLNDHPEINRNDIEILETTNTEI